MVRIEKKTKRYPSDLTDEEWDALEPFLPQPAKRAANGRLTFERSSTLCAVHGAQRMRMADASDPFPALVDGVLFQAVRIVTQVWDS
jgi:transposase